MRIFYDEIYHQSMERQELHEDKSWSEALKSLNWHNQLNWFLFHHKNEIDINSEIAKKASAWFHVTYKRLNHRKSNKNQSLFSFCLARLSYTIENFR